MKQVIIAFSALIFMTSCSKSNNSAVPSTAVNASTVATSGSWGISSLVQREEDKSSQLQGYTFSFGTSGSLQAEKNGVTINGSWSYIPSAVSYYGSTPSNASMSISLGSEKPLSQISRIWNVDSTATTANKIALISPEVAENMRLVFVRK